MESADGDSLLDTRP